MTENMTDKDMRLGQLNNDMTYYDNEGKHNEQDITRQSCLPVSVTIVEYGTNYCNLVYPESRAHNFYPSCVHACILRLTPRCC